MAPYNERCSHCGKSTWGAASCVQCCTHAGYNHNMDTNTRRCLVCGYQWIPTADEIGAEDAEMDGELDEDCYN